MEATYILLSGAAIILIAGAIYAFTMKPKQQLPRKELILLDEFWKESLNEMMILHWQDKELTINEILKLKNNLIKTLDKSLGE